MDLFDPRPRRALRDFLTLGLGPTPALGRVERAAGSVLAAIGRIAGRVRDELLQFKPKVQLPGGVSLQLG